ncbi:MAG: GNAT family N-acetyltransferase [Bacteroidota bacterium]|nr:GNAT family N-acetyltransferase [Bacteroidota bacterium]
MEFIPLGKWIRTMSCQILPFKSPLQIASIALRRKVLRIPLGLDFTDQELAEEDQQIHFAYIVKQQVLGVLLLKPQDEQMLKMRQVAVDPTQQGQGIGKSMVAFSEQWAKENGFNTIELNARKTAVPFYLNLAYQIEGSEFEEVGVPHYKMVKKLSSIA